jgi:cellulose biosynthesis protein BcsQ
MLAEKGHKTILVDADPQCNLTGMLLGYMGPSELESFYTKHPERNIKAALAPAFESRPKLLEAVECLPVKHRRDLFLLPGHIGFSEYEVTLGIAQELSGSIQTLQNLPGSLSFLLDKTAEHFNAEYVLIDMSPSLSSINQNLLTTSDFFLVPTNPDFFSVMAIDSLATILPKWNSWAKKAASLPILREATYPMPKVSTKFLGTIIQKFRPRAGAPARGFQHWIDELEDSVRQKLMPALKDAGLMLPRKWYDNVDMESDLWLAVISDFNTLIAKSQKWQTPVFALTAKQIGQQGIVLRGTVRSRDAFWEVFSELADRVIGLTGHAGSN